MMRQNFTTKDISLKKFEQKSFCLKDAARSESATAKISSLIPSGGLPRPLGARILRGVLTAMLVAVMVLFAPQKSQARLDIDLSIVVAPPPLPVYEQPICPGPGFIWTPGYWAWGPEGYFWVPGTWILAPYPGELWTPGYWAWDGDDGVYAWSPGYWGLEVGFYGGVNYGYGYFGRGYEGGYWRDRTFYYNTAVNRVNRTTITNVYTKNVVNNYNRTYVSYNGGSGGINARPTTTELAAARMRHDPPASVQQTQVQAARANRAQLASVNRGRPEIAATPKPGKLAGPGVVRADRAGGPVNFAANRADQNRAVKSDGKLRNPKTPLNNQQPKASPRGQPGGQSHVPQANPRNEKAPMNNRQPKASPRGQPGGQSHVPDAVRPTARPPANPPHAAPGRVKPNVQKPHQPKTRPEGPPHSAQAMPHNSVRYQNAPHAQPNTRSVNLNRSSARPQPTKRTVAGSKPRSQPAPRTAMKRQSAPEPRTAQRRNPKPPHGGHLGN